MVINIRKSTRNYVETILKDYPKLGSYITERKEEITTFRKSDDDNFGGGRSSNVSRPQEEYMVTIDADRRLAVLERNKKAVEVCLKDANVDTTHIIEELYFKKYPEYTLGGLCVNHKVHCSTRTASRLRREFLEDLAKELKLA